MTEQKSKRLWPIRRTKPAGFAGVYSSVERVLQTPELLQRILGRLNKQEIDHLCLLKKSLVPKIFAIRFGKVSWREYKTADRSTTFGRMKCDSVRMLCAARHMCDPPFGTYSAPPSPAAFDADLIDNVLEKCPNIRIIVCGLEGGSETECRRFQIGDGGKNRVAHIRVAVDWDGESGQSRLRKGFDPQRLEWPGWTLDLTKELVMAPDPPRTVHTPPDSLLKPLLPLLAGKLVDQQVVSLDIEYPVNLAQLQTILQYDSCPIREVRVRELSPFTLKELEEFGKEVGHKIRKLDLSHRFTGGFVGGSVPQAEKPILTAYDLPNLVRVIKELFKWLEFLRLPISIFVGRDFLANDAITVTDLPYSTVNAALKHVSILVESEFKGPGEPSNIPIYALARNLAALGGPSTTFHIGCWYGAPYESSIDDIDYEDEDYNHIFIKHEGWPKLMDDLVNYLRFLPIHQQNSLRVANLAKLDLDPHLPINLLGLTFRPDGSPIPGTVAEARELVDTLLSDYPTMAKALRKNMEEALRLREEVPDWEALLKERGIPFESPIWPFDNEEERVKAKLEELRVILQEEKDGWQAAKYRLDMFESDLVQAEYLHDEDVDRAQDELKGLQKELSEVKAQKSS